MKGIAWEPKAKTLLFARPKLDANPGMVATPAPAFSSCAQGRKRWGAGLLFVAF
jgi:hypothetical protein